MRIPLATAAALALLATACSSSSGPTTSGAGTTTGGPPLLAAGAPCASNDDCSSGVCGVDGGGNCCRTACDTSSGACSATACDTEGLCLYPSVGTACGVSCSDALLTPNSCDGAGSCESGAPSSCADDYGCDSDGGACNLTCASSADCASGFFCNAGSCIGNRHFGSCTEGDDCSSGVCGVNGTGDCCLAACPSTSATCAATGCDPASGVCIYPESSTACGTVPASCSDDVQQNPSVCDGLGNCPAPETAACSPFSCGPSACYTSCTDATTCQSGEFCDTADATCCADLSSPVTIQVDSMRGNDAAGCCGVGGHTPCQTITHAMKLIDNAQLKNVTISVAVDGKSGTWFPSAEVYPIVLGWEAELSAPGVDFYDPEGNPEIFDVRPVSANDVGGSASIVGLSDNLVSIGMDSQGHQTTDLAAIAVEKGSALYLANASVNGSAASKSAAIRLAAGASLVLGQDMTNEMTGTVTIGNAANSPDTDGYDGILCAGANGLGCSISDATLFAKSSLVIEGQEDLDIDAEDGAQIALVSAPVIGIAPATPGYDQCLAKPDVSTGLGQAVLLHGTASVSLENGTVQCISGAGFRLTASSAGVPTLDLSKTIVQNTELGVYASAGTAVLTSSTIQYNYNGVEQDTDGTNIATINLSSAEGDAGTSTVACCNSAESIGFAAGTIPPAVAVLNTTSQALDANDVDWDTPGPDLFMCNSKLTSCSCEIGSCTADAGSDGMDAVYESTGTITTEGNEVSSDDCTPPAGICGPNKQCPNGEICCNSPIVKVPYCAQFCQG